MRRRAARVSDAMTHGVVTCPPELPLRQVAVVMVRECVHAVVVFAAGAASNVWGLVSDLDIVAAWRGDNFDTLTAHDAFVVPRVTVHPDDTLGRASQLLAETGMSHLAVVDPRSGMPVGLVTPLDVARTLVSDDG